MAKEKDLNDAFYETLKDVYYAEKQSVKACKKGTKNAQALDLRKAFQEHGEASESHVVRLEKIFEIIGKSARAKTCEAMKGIVTEMTEDLEDFGGTSAGDAVLIGCAQAVEHYEIARYGMLKTWAHQLDMSEVARLLGETLAEEKAADEKLTSLAETINKKAA